MSHSDNVFLNAINKIGQYINMQGNPAAELSDSQWLCDLAFMVDISKHLSKLNMNCTNQQLPQRGGVVPNPVRVEMAVGLSEVPVNPDTPLHFFAMLPPEQLQKSSTQLP